MGLGRAVRDKRGAGHRPECVSERREFPGAARSLRRRGQVQETGLLERLKRLNLQK